jgi:alpha-tubulin suppressor-like RCC1 family protein
MDNEGSKSYLYHTQIPNTPSVYTWGSNKNYVLGHANGEDRASPEIITSEFTARRKITGIDLNTIFPKIDDFKIGKYHSAIIANGTLFVWGFGSGGRLGLGKLETKFTPTPVVFDRRIHITSVQLGHTHTIALSSDGIVYTWGSNEYGQLGT